MPPEGAKQRNSWAGAKRYGLRDSFLQDAHTGLKFALRGVKGERRETFIHLRTLRLVERFEAKERTAPKVQRIGVFPILTGRTFAHRTISGSERIA